jgi:hypothetical protein
MRIARDGTWFYRGSPIARLPLVKLFASVRVVRQTAIIGWLPRAERGRSVEDVPFLAVALTVEGQGREQQLIFRTNLDDIVTAGPDNPLRIETSPNGEPAPYIWYAKTSKQNWAAGVLRDGRARQRGAGREYHPIRGMEQGHVFGLGTPGPD